MNFVLTFSHNTARYSCHAEGCAQARTTRDKSLIAPGTFASIKEARRWADKDEQQKGGDEALFHVCGCCRKGV